MGPLAAAGLVVGGIQGVTGLIQQSKANNALKELGQTPIDEYSISPEMMNSYQRAEAMADQGFTAEEKAAFGQGVARQQAGVFRSAVDASGGNLSQAIGSALKAQNIGAQVDFAAQGARLRGDNMRYANDIAGRIQNQKNLMTEAKRQRRMMLEQAYGQAKQTGTENLINGLTGGLTAFGAASKTTNEVPDPDPNEILY